jgi:hypothetical protein
MISTNSKKEKNSYFERHKRMLEEEEEERERMMGKTFFLLSYMTHIKNEDKKRWIVCESGKRARN